MHDTCHTCQRPREEIEVEKVTDRTGCRKPEGAGKDREARQRSRRKWENIGQEKMNRGEEKEATNRKGYNQTWRNGKEMIGKRKKRQVHTRFESQLAVQIACFIEHRVNIGPAVGRAKAN